MGEDFKPICQRAEWLDPFYKRVWEKAFQEGIPISGTFELTPRCNFDCKMCYVHLKNEEISSHGQELTAAEWLRIAEEAKKAGTTWLCISGGEPLMHPEFKEIWKSLASMGFYISLQTNASLISESIVDLFEKCPPRLVKVTLYGTTDDVYQKVCGIEGGFSRVNDGIHTLMSLGIPVELVSTIIRQNVADLQQMMQYARVHGLPWRATGGVKSSFRNAEKRVEQVRITEKVDAEMYTDIEHRLSEKRFVDVNRKPCTYCRDYRLGYCILWNGNMGFCTFLNRPQIPVKEMSFEKAWQLLLEYEEALEWPRNCQICEASKVCFKCLASLGITCDGKMTVNGIKCHDIQKFYKNKIKRKEDYHG